MNNTPSAFTPETFDVAAYNAIINRGLSSGKGDRQGQMCIEAAICTVLGLPHGDDPGCVAASVRRYKIALNDKAWSSPGARAAGLRDLGLAQLGSLGVVSDVEFMTKLAEKTIRVLLPRLVREVFPTKTELLDLAAACEREGNSESALVLSKAADTDATYAAYAAAYAAADADADAAAYAAADADADAAAARSAKRDEYLALSASLALEVLRELNSPGVQLLEVAAA